MTNDPDLGRRMSRFENETIAIYDLINDQRSILTNFRSETRDRFDRIETTLSEVLRRLP